MRVQKSYASKVRSFVGAFPPPGFLTMPAAAIDISDTSIKYLDTEYTNAGCTPRKFDNLDLPEGIVVGGVVQDTTMLAEYLRPLRETHGREFALVALPEELAYLYTVYVPKTDEVDLKEVIEFSLAENVPISAEDAVFDYDIIHKPSGGAEVSVTVYERAVVNGYVEALERAGFTVRLCELEARSVVRSVVPRDNAGMSMIIDLGRTRTGITIARGGTPLFSTTVHIGGQALTDAIKELKSIDDAEADAIKREVGLGSDDEELNKILMASVGKLVSEIDRHYQFWNSKRGEGGEHIDPVSNIYLCGCLLYTSPSPRD